MKASRLALIGNGFWYDLYPYLTATGTVPIPQLAAGPTPPTAVQALVEVQERPFRNLKLFSALLGED